MPNKTKPISPCLDCPIVDSCENDNCEVWQAYQDALLEFEIKGKVN